MPKAPLSYSKIKQQSREGSALLFTFHSTLQNRDL